MRRRLSVAWFALAAACWAMAVAANAQTIPAFAGADGAAANVTGGRGGLVYHVTKLDKNMSDNGPGTLRYGLSDGNFTVGGVVQPRTIVFDVAGTFWLGRLGAESGHDNGWDSNSRYNLGSQITVAGQTAPGPVTIMGGLVKANGTNTILRNVTIAPGYGMRNFSKPEDGVQPTPGDFPDSYVYDAIDITGTNLMIDHVTTAYATDETISANELANNVTIQYSNISQGQNYPQADAEGSGVTFTGHGLGSLLQGGSNAKFSIHHNLYAHQKGRLPRVGSEVGTGAFNDFRNNVFYNWLGTAGGGAGGQPSFNNFVGNFWRAGPGGDNVAQLPGPDGRTGTLDDVGVVIPAAGGTAIFNGSNSTGTRVYHSGNLKDINKDGDANDGVALANSDFGSSNFQVGPLWSGGTPTYNGVTDSATEAYNRVLNYMGANWWTRDNVIDTIDERIIHEVRTGTGKIMAWADDPFNANANEGKEWRAMLAKRADPVTGAAPYNHDADWDVDGDGMPDYWERAHRLNSAVADNNSDFDADGYTNLEEYINEIAAWPAPSTIVFNGATNQRYAQITNWDVNPDFFTTHNWQPSRYDAVTIQGAAVTVDAVGQHAGSMTLDQHGTLNVTDGWLEIAGPVSVGSVGVGVINHDGGVLAADSITLGGSAPAAGGTYNLGGDATLRVGRLTKGANGAKFYFWGGTLSADVVAFDLAAGPGLIAPGSGIGSTHIQGDLHMVGADIEIEIGGTGVGAFDRIHIDGVANLSGDVHIKLVDVDGQPFSPVPGDQFPFLTADGGIGGGIGIPRPPEFPDYWKWAIIEEGNTLSLLYIGGTPPPNANFNGDGFVDGNDFLVWQRGRGLANQTDRSNGDANGDGVVDADDLAVWRQQFGTTALPEATTIPEPQSVVLLATVLACGYRRIRRDLRTARD